MWNVTVIPLVIRAPGNVQKCVGRDERNGKLKENLELRTAVLLKTARILRKVLEP